MSIWRGKITVSTASANRKTLSLTRIIVAVPTLLFLGIIVYFYGSSSGVFEKLWCGSGSASGDVGSANSFEIAYPCAWDSPADDQSFGNGPDPDDFLINKNVPAAFAISSQNGSALPNTLNGAARNLDESLPKTFKDFKKVGTKQVTLKTSGRALKYSFSFTSGPDNSPIMMKQVIYVVLKPKRTFFIRAWAPTNLFASIEPDISFAADCFRSPMGVGSKSYYRSCDRMNPFAY